MADDLFFKAVGMTVTPDQAKEIAKAVGIKKVMNKDIVAALQALGVKLPPDMDIRGNQHDEFKKRLATFGVNSEKFHQAEVLAGWNGENVGDIVGGAFQLDENQARQAFNNYGSLTKTGQLPPPPPPPGQPGPGQLPAAASDPLAYLHPKAAQAPAAPAQIPLGPTPPSIDHEGQAGLARSTAPAPAAKVQSPKAPAKKPGGGPGAGAPDLGGAGDKGLPPNAPQADVEKYFRDHYGAEAWMLNLPDFKDLIRKVVTTPGGMTDSMVIGEVQKTPWWVSNGATVVDYLTKQSNDPQGFKKVIGAKTTWFKQHGNQFGMAMDDATLNNLANEAYKWNWDEDQMETSLSQQFHFDQSRPTAFTDKLRADAKNFLVSVDPAAIDNWGRRIIQDPNESVNYQEFLKEQAKSMFPSFAGRLDGGETMAQIAQPYADTAAKWLEIDPKSVDFTDPKWMKALDKVDDKGNHSNMSYSEWATTLKNDPVYRYDYTDNAKQAATGIATNLLKTFGAIA